VTELTYTFSMSAFSLSVTYANGHSWSWARPAYKYTYSYYIVESALGVIFRVASSQTDVTALGYMLSAYVKIPDSMLSSATGLCKGFDSTTQTPLSFTSNLFENASLQEALARNGWNADGTTVPGSAAACFGSNGASRRLGGRRTVAEDNATCIGNGVDMEEGRAACVGAMGGGGSSGMLDACVSDWCSFGGDASIASSYTVEDVAVTSLDNTILTPNYVAPPPPPAIQITQSIYFIIPSMSSAAAFNADTAAQDAYGKGYGVTIGSVILVGTSYVYHTGCSVTVTATDARRSAMNLQFVAVVPTDLNIDQATAAQGVTNATSLATSITQVIQSDSSVYALVAAVSTSGSATVIGSVGQVATTTINEGDASSSISTGWIILLTLLCSIAMLSIAGAVVWKVLSLRKRETALKQESEKNIENIGI